MKTLLLVLACALLIGCARPVPAGMENLGSVRDFTYAASNQTHVSEASENAALAVLDFAVGVAVSSQLPPHD